MLNNDFYIKHKIQCETSLRCMTFLYSEMIFQKRKKNHRCFLLSIKQRKFSDWNIEVTKKCLIFFFFCIFIIKNVLNLEKKYFKACFFSTFE